jgi:hypothetical protein
MKMILNSSSMILIRIHEPLPKSWQHFQQQFLRRIRYHKRLERPYFNQNLGIKTFLSNHPLWTAKFGQLCHKTREKMTKTSGVLCIASLPWLNPSTTLFAWYTHPNQKTKMEKHIKHGHCWNRRCLTIESWRWTRFLSSTSYGKNRHSRLQSFHHIINRLIKRKFSAMNYTILSRRRMKLTNCLMTQHINGKEPLNNPIIRITNILITMLISGIPTSSIRNPRTIIRMEDTLHTRNTKETNKRLGNWLTTNLTTKIESAHTGYKDRRTSKKFSNTMASFFRQILGNEYYYEWILPRMAQPTSSSTHTQCLKFKFFFGCGPATKKSGLDAGYQF